MKKQQAVRLGMYVGMLTLMAVALVTGAALAAPTPPPVVVGDWNGALSTGGGSLRVAIHVVQDQDGKLTATMDSPDQGATGIEITTISFKQPDLHFEIARFGASYDGQINKDNSGISGNWKQGSASLPLTFKRVSK